MTKRLECLKVLVSRLSQHAAPIAREIESLGGHAVCQPLYTVDPTIDEGVLKHLSILDGSTYLAVFISRNAVEIAMPYLSRGFAKNWAAMGPSTAEQLYTRGIETVISPGFSNANNVGLFNLMLEKKLEFKGSKVVIFTGADFDSSLYDNLERAHAEVENLVVYKRGVPNNLNIPHDIDVILITCVTSLMNLHNALPDLDLPIVAASDRIARVALEKGYSKVYTSNSMQDVDLIDALSKVRDAKQRN